MKTITLSLILFGFFQLLNAQEIHNEYKYYYGKDRLIGSGEKNEKGEKNGLWEEYDMNSGKIIAKGFYKKNIKNGKWTSYNYFTNKTIITFGNYSNGQKEGKWESFFSENNLKSVSFFNKNKKTGTWQSFYENGNKSSVTNYNNDILDGITKYFYENGKPKQTLLYIEGKVTEEKWYYDNEQVRIDITKTRNGELISEKRYYENGKLEFIEKNSKVIGYYANGNIKVSGLRKDNEKFDKWKYFYENGKTKQIGYFKNDYLVGEWKAYYENGNIKSIETYSKDTKSKPYEETEKETVISSTSFDHYSPKPSIEIFEQKSKLSGIGEVGRTSIKNGKWLTYYENGHLESSGKYFYDSLNGIWEYFYDNRKKRIVANWNKGKLVDINEIRDSNGKTLNKGTFSNGNGLLFIYNLNGELDKKINFNNGRITN